MMAAAALVFFAFYGFDAVSTAAEETRNPSRDLKVGIIGSMLLCTLIYMAVGAAALGDIGCLFPDTDATWKDADSRALLRQAVALVRQAGYRVGNVDATVIADRPKLLPHLPEIRANLALALDVDLPAVSVKGKTNEGVDAIGRGEAIAAHAVALLTRV